MRKLFCLLLASIMALALISCGGNDASSGSSAPIEYADEDFVSDVASALEDRWDNSDKMEVDSMDTESGEFVNAMTTLADGEIETLSKYRTATFKDGQLQELAIKYLNNLDKAKEVVAKLPSDFMNASVEWDAVYNERTTMIQTLLDKYGLKVSDKYADTLSEITANANSVAKKDEEKEKVEKLAASLKFEEQKEDWDTYSTYTTKFKNDTGLNFEYLSFQIDLLDKDDTVIEQQTVWFDNVADGKSYSGDFMTDAKFDHYKVTAEYTVAS